MLRRDNEFAKVFHHVRYRFKDVNFISAKLRLVTNRQTDGRNSNNPPNAHEFAAIIVEDNLSEPREIVVEYKGGALKRISVLNPSFMAYPLIFTYGEDGYRTGILHRGVSTASKDKRNVVSMRQFYFFRLQHRDDEGHTLIRSGRLFLQFVVDAWACIEHARLVFVLKKPINLKKRGLPHAHIVVWIDESDKCKNTDDIDLLISAEIPDKEVDPIGYESVSKFMVHGPCGELNSKYACMKDHKCTKLFPKDFNNETIIDSKGYVVYKRHNDGRTIMCKDVAVDNIFIVTYNRGLIVKYQAHINVEWCNQGATMAIEKSENNEPGYDDNNEDDGKRNKSEVDDYIACRYEDSTQMQRCSYSGLKRIKDTQVGEHCHIYNFLKSLGGIIRANYGFNEKIRSVLGRLIYIHPIARELFFLRMLLNVVRGATSFRDIRTINGVTYDTYKEACLKYGLLESDDDWQLAITDASVHQTGSQLLLLFVTLLFFSDISDVHALWNKNWRLMSDDIEYKERKNSGLRNFTISDQRLQSLALFDVDSQLRKQGNHY
ncbi:uncharacterized protein LOC141673677 [Apium graveolens]|uniref:uncharacterized protein LOC141673677 n=1 Tax=Apium graveolens TaxID=4045 RepID=UPI003D7BACF4